MTLARLRRNTHWTGGRKKRQKAPTEDAQPSDAQQAQQLERVRDVPKKPSLNDEYLEALPAINARYDLCTTVELDIALGKATPQGILAALEPEEHDLTRTYTESYRSGLELACHNYGINPETGKPDGVAADLLLRAIAAGADDQGALGYAFLAAHSKIPDQMMRDLRFQRRLRDARQQASRRVQT